MKNFTLIFILILIVVACQNQAKEKPNLEGDLYYTPFSLGSFYGWPDSVYQNYLALRDSVGIEALRKEDTLMISNIELLEKHQLIKSPFIYVKTDTDAVFTVYMTPEDYQPITEFTYQDLIDQQQKVRLKLITEPFIGQFQICKKVISIEKIDGETLQKQKKFKLKDYR